MESIIYLLKVNIAILIFYCIYRLLFQKDTLFRFKRFALLAIIFISFLYPAIDLTRQVTANHQLNNIFEIVYYPVYSLPEVIITANSNTSINFFPDVLLAIYIFITSILFIRMMIQIGTIFYKLHRTSKKVLFGHTIFDSPGLKTPFSFFKWIALDSSLYSETELQEILLHETTHVVQVHSADTLLAEFVCVFCWFNPFVWLLKTEIRMNLEFLADKSVLSSGLGAEHYQFHLLRLSYHKAAATITNNFNVSLLKKRIFMMNKKQTSYRSIWKYILILPIVALLLFFNSAFQTKAEQKSVIDIVQPDNEMIFDQPDQSISPSIEQPVNLSVSQSKETKQDDKQQKPVIYSHVQQPPKYPGGDQALLDFLKDNITYPKEAAEKGIQGVVGLRFVVTPTGAVEDVEVISGLYPACNEEAIRVVKMMPKWIPGKQSGEPVYVFYSLPVRFMLAKSNADNPATTSIQTIDNKPTFTHVEEPPIYPGGDVALLRFLRDNVVYPAKAAEQGVTGRVIVRFVVKSDGSVDNIEVLQGLYPSCDKEAMRAVEKMPKWIPGKQSGKPVDVYISLPVVFKLSGSPNIPPETTITQTGNMIPELTVVGYGASKK